MGRKPPTVPVYRSTEELESYAIGTVLVLGGTAALVFVMLQTGIPGWVLVGACLIATVLCRTKSWTFGRLNNAGLTVVLATIAFASLGLLPIDAFRSSEIAFKADVARLSQLEHTDPNAARKQLQAAEEYVVGALADKGSALAQKEQERRAELQQQSAAQQNLALERKNADAIKYLVSEVDALPADDYIGRAEGYRKLVSLAPGNKGYIALSEAADKRLAEYKHRLDHPEESIAIKRQSWSKGGFGTTYMLDITLKNTSDRPYKDFEVQCLNRAHSGTVVDGNSGTLMEVLKAGEVRRFRRVNLGFLNPAAATSICRVNAAAPY